MSEEKSLDLEDLLFTKAVLVHAFIMSALKRIYSEDDALLFAEKTLIAIQRKKNIHTDKHQTAYDVNCAFCVDLVHTSNEEQDLASSFKWRSAVIEIAERFISRDVWEQYQGAIREAFVEWQKKDEIS